jgi:hypothetical protein
MSESMTKAKMLDLIRAERELLEAELAGISQERMTQPGVVDNWSVKDILAHISVWEKQMVGWLAESLRGEAPQQLSSGVAWDLDGWNEQIYQKNRDKPLDQVLAEFDHSYSKALKAAKAVPEGELIDPNRFAWRESKPLWQMVAANTFWHYKEHRETIHQWLAKVA